ncbi:TRAFAC clade GTPase domain-containing protein [Cellulomonas denverensis]|uniref:ATP/GTP-binding protein n=1 Tax=Cellulomonas denverensis TaxID=264297 RepID=A0A7X6KVL5_9CELL|nr:ATP/GTP-binding protein [Cellulomonas denverensis]NKY23127.1 ATP/GTP-binding protein [Cellulomonas denverensis]
MRLSKVLEQHIAVFGESGSGKTVMLSSFYGATQEADFRRQSLYSVSADDIGQGHRLQSNYLGMKKSARVPGTDHFAATSYSFSVRLRDGNPRAARTKPFDSLRLVWHDYPGEWFEQDVSGPEEARRRVEAFRSLLASDVALLLVDGQRLLDNAGHEERYLRSLFHDFRAVLEKLEGELLSDGRLAEFPRIWILALSKADLLPELDAYEFRDLLIEKASDDLAQLREVLGRFVESSAAMSVGEDFLVLSSARFADDRIEVATRVGLDLVLPVAALVPLERYVQWAEAKTIGGKAADALLAQAGPLATALIGKAADRLPAPIGAVANLVLSAIGPQTLSDAARLGGDKLRQANSAALSRQDVVAAVLTRFKMDLDQGEADKTLLRRLA